MPNAFDYGSLSLGILILGFLWKFQRDVHRDIADLRERMARLEGLFKGFTRSTPQQPQSS